jgi:predicted GH43/DUF377 family glycosyl hydrolase
MKLRSLTTRSDIRILPDPARVVTMLFVAGQELVGGTESRASRVVERVVALSEADVTRRLHDVMHRFGRRHRDILGTFSQHAERIAGRLDPSVELSEDRWLLLGASFTQEYAVEAAAVCNPSMVLHPDQSGAPRGGARFVMSFRGIGEGHRSSIGFRTGSIGSDGAVTVDARAPLATTGTVHAGVYHQDAFHARLRALGMDGESAAYVLDHLPPSFSIEELEARLVVLMSERDTRRDAIALARQLRSIAACSYRVRFRADTDISERVLSPVMVAESHGMEDARFVRFVGADGTPTYLATYTAFDGTNISQQLLQTDDFLSFTASPVVGEVASHKGLALFPRHVNGQFAAMSRQDRETNAVTYSETLGHWGAPFTCQVPETDWEVIQLGNCGSPIETDAGWLVLTHGVGPMRTYSIGALLLDLHDPTKMVASLKEPLLTACADEQDGYVPNVVYTCGALLHGDTLVIPYGVADMRINIATVPLPGLIAELLNQE